MKIPQVTTNTDGPIHFKFMRLNEQVHEKR